MSGQSKHLIEYLMIIAFSIIFLFLFYIFRSQKNVLQIIDALISAFYVSWGIIHAALEGRLNKLIAFEYLGFGTMVFLTLDIALSF